MQRAESYAALAPLLSAQLRRGVVTNCFLSAEDYQRELPRGLPASAAAAARAPDPELLPAARRDVFPAGRKKARRDRAQLPR